LSMYCKPAVVKIYVGPYGTFFYKPPNWSQGKTYQVSYIGTGSGFFINSNGYIGTNAHVTQGYHDGDEKAKENLFRAYVQQVAKDYDTDPRRLTRENINFIAQHTQMTGYQLIHHVVIPDGSPYPFEIKSYGAPAGEGENWKDVSIIKIEVKNAPILVFGDSEKMQLQDHATVIGYPGAADSSDPNILSTKSELEASITDGKVSARKSTGGGVPVLQISASATHGNSGGPVLNDAMEVIGLLTFRGNTVFGQEVQGFNFVVASNTVKEFLTGVPNELGASDKAYREGLELYWTQQFKSAIQKFEEVKRLFPQHSEVDRLIQSSQQAITEGKDRSGMSGWWLIAGVIVILMLLFTVLIVALIIFLLMRRRSKARTLGPASAAPAMASSTPSRSAYSPSPPPSPAYTPAAAAKAPPVPATPQVSPPTAADQGKTVDLSATIAIQPDTSPINFGSIKFTSGTLAGKQFDVTAEGAAIGRDSTLSQIIVADPRISKRHVWIGVRDGQVTIIDHDSRNGTFVNDPKSPRVTETTLNSGDTVILGESDVARFEYRK
ncbi:MAG TPA: trypsin-like peptidase domain-containing protein, partial [Pyrinomonadaceae bacterium]|nr:trypsin-like peptidase domain-containing protein [Pyrinomonadaceae bacterium]